MHTFRLLHLALSEELFFILKNCSAYAMICATAIENEKENISAAKNKNHGCFVFCWLNGESTMVQSKTMMHIEKSSTQSAKVLRKLTFYSW